VSRAARLVCAAAVAAAPIAWFAVPPAAAAGCNPTELRTDATINRDGSMDVIEHFTYEFSGTCHGGIREIPLLATQTDDNLGATDYTLSRIEVTEGGQPVPIAEERPGFVRWGQADVTVSGTHRYDLSYHVGDAVHVAPDVGVLFWQFVGTDFPFMRHVEVTIHTPGDGSGLRIFVHGALNGVSRLDGPTVHLAVDDNPKGTIVEARLLEPAGDFSVTPSGPALEQPIIDREGVLADKANQRRQQLRDRLARERTLRRIGNVAGPVVALGGIAAFVALFVRWGKEPDRPDDVGEYWREIPTDTPAVCQTLVRFGSVPDEAFTATLVDLAQRGWLTIGEQHESGLFGRDKREYVFTRTPKADGPLTAYESRLLWRLFPSGGVVTQAQLVEDAKHDRQAAARWMKEFKYEVHVDYVVKGYLDAGHWQKWLLHGVTVAVLFGAAALIGLAFKSWGGIAPLAAGVVLVGLSPLLRKRTPKGARAVAQVLGLRNFLKDFSRLADESHAGDLVLYERYLVYAVALGVARELVDGLRVRFPELADPGSGFATWYASGTIGGLHGGGLDGVANIDSFASEFSSATAAAFSPPSSSSGAGGGFSGGGGGGGGGGGAGGW